jgi:L-arabinokinase
MTSNPTAAYRIITGDTFDLPDVTAFLTTLNRLRSHPARPVRELFDDSADVILARAPGRLDLMGGIADYSGSLVLQWPIREATIAAVQLRTDRKLSIISLSKDASREIDFKIELEAFEPNGAPIEYEAARNLLAQDRSRSWAAYAAGAFPVLMRECSARFPQGASILISSDVPEGKGVSSSAAIEVAVMSALTAAYDLLIPPREMGLLCQKIENLVVGAPCGVMDQMTSACGHAFHLLALLCQPAELQGRIILPEDLAIWGIDSGVRHSVGEGDYGSVRIGAFMGYRIIADLAGLPVTARSARGVLSIDDPLWHGFLANLSPAEFESDYAQRLPRQIKGADFLSRYEGTTDLVTQIDAERTYKVLAPARHPVYEHFRVRAFAAILQSKESERRNELLGELMYQSHQSYSACGLGSQGANLLVDLVRKEGTSHGLYGAKITGGGSGGTVAILGRKDARDTIERVAQAYAAASGKQPYLFSDSSPGSAAFGHLHLRRLEG